MTPIQQHGSSEDLTQFCANEWRELVGDIVTIIRTFCTDTNFDELVLFEGGIYGGDDSVGQAVFAELNERIEVMSERSQVSSLLTGQAHGLSANDRRKIESFRGERIVVWGKPVKLQRAIVCG